MTLRLVLFLAALLLLGRVSPAAAELRAWLDRDEIALGETVTLNIQVQGAGATAPDFSALDQDFDRRGSSSNSQISLVNGQRSATTLFAVSLQPRREGELQVPSIQVGNERTPPLRLTVGPSPIDTGSGGDVFLEASIDPGEVYVQQQVLYSLKLFYAVSLWDGQLDAPGGDGVQSVRLGDDLKYQVERNGRRYSVIERRFALMPERSGSLTIGAARFDGTGLDRGGYGGLLGSGGIRLSATGKPLTLQVKPRPASAAEPWLPATDVQLESSGEVWPDEVRIGEPLSIVLQLRAKGLVASQLPELELPAIAGAAVYPEQASSRDQSSADGLAGERFRRFAIVPQQAGTLEIPAIRLAWWDTVQDEQRWAELAPRRIKVLPAAGGAASSDAPSPAAEAAPDPPRNSTTQRDDRFFSLPAWPWMLLSLALALGWWISHRLRGRLPLAADTTKTLQAPRPVESLKSALRGGDPKAIAEALRDAAPAGARRSLQAVAAALADRAQKDAVLRLERHLFAAGGGSPDEVVQTLRAAFARSPEWRKSEPSSPQSKGPYPPLYG